MLVKNGFSGKVYCTHATRDLCKVLLLDSAHLQEEEAEFANRRGFSKHHPALPLYTKDDAERAIELLTPVEIEKEMHITGNMYASFSPNGHILGSVFVKIHNTKTSILFSGDLGRSQDVLMRPPSPIKNTDYLVLESTYGNRLHDDEDTMLRLATIINRTAKRKGVVMIPVFAVGARRSCCTAFICLKIQGK